MLSGGLAGLQGGVAAAADARRPTAEGTAAAAHAAKPAQPGSLQALSVAGCGQVGGSGLQELCRVCAKTLASLDVSRTHINALPNVVGKVTLLCPVVHR